MSARKIQFGVEVRCSNCAWVHTFNPRPDEIERGLTMGCKYPDWEGYTKDEEPACGGVFFSAALQRAKGEE